MVSINKKISKYVSKKSGFAMNAVKKNNKKYFVNNDNNDSYLEKSNRPESLPPTLQPPASATKRKFKSESERKRWEEKLFKVKPYGYYHSKPYMSEKEIHDEMLKTSQHVEHCNSSFAANHSNNKDSDEGCLSCSQIFNRFGIENPTHHDGRIGSLLVEVLGCVRLPKPNTFVYLLCGDSAFSTDVISSFRSPKWPCRSKRAVLFPIHHAFAKLYVGVFNIEEKKTVNDKFAGRVVLDLSVLKHNTVYDVTLPLRESANVYSCKPRGVIRLRFHLHWCNEKSAITSYLQRPTIRSKNNISIPCADAKTFRNVAYTLYGKHLPGKYSNTSYRSTMREMNLYKLQFEYLVIKLLLSFIVWDKPHISAYIFISWILTAYFSAPSMVPCIVVGLIIILLLTNYNTFVSNNKTNGGYAPLNLTELFLSLTIGTHCNSKNDNVKAMEPLLVHKKLAPKRPSSLTTAEQLQYELQHISGNSLSYDDTCDEILDHAEFPFSEKNKYQKINVTNALFTKKKSIPNERLHEREMNRLSIYQKTVKMDKAWSDALLSSNDTYNDDDSPSDDESLSSDEDECDNEALLNNNVTSTSLLSIACYHMISKTAQSIPIGPEQCDDDSGTSVPFKIVLKRLERFVNKITFGLFDEVNLHVVQETSIDRSSFISHVDQNPRAVFYDPKNHMHTINHNTDDFDRLLGLKQISSEEKYGGMPVQHMIAKLKSEYQGPVMRMINTGLIMTRIMVNVFIWKDPILSFWFLLFLILLMFILAFFPWREVLLLGGFVAFGPQNYLLKKNILKRILKSSSSMSSKKDDELDKYSSSANRAFYGQHKKDTNASTSSSTIEPRQVHVPYTPFRRDRFYDWPPSPAVSRATPLNFSNMSNSSNADTIELKMK